MLLHFKKVLRHVRISFHYPGLHISHDFSPQCNTLALMNVVIKVVIVNYYETIIKTVSITAHKIIYIIFQLS